MTLSEKKQIYLDRFPAIIGRRMADQFDETHWMMATELFAISNEFDEFYRLWLGHFLNLFQRWSMTNEGHHFWMDIFELYHNETIEHQQILDIFHKHGIKP